MKLIFSYIHILLGFVYPLTVYGTQSQHVDPVVVSMPIDEALRASPKLMLLETLSISCEGLPTDKFIVIVGVTDRGCVSGYGLFGHTALFCIGKNLPHLRKNPQNIRQPLDYHQIHGANFQGFSNSVCCQLDGHDKEVKEYQEFLSNISDMTNYTEIGKQMKKLATLCGITDPRSDTSLCHCNQYIHVRIWLETPVIDDILKKINKQDEDNKLRQKYHEGKLTRQDIENRKNELRNMPNLSSRLKWNLNVYEFLLNQFSDIKLWETHLMVKGPTEITPQTVSGYKMITETAIEITRAEYEKVYERIRNARLFHDGRQFDDGNGGRYVLDRELHNCDDFVEALWKGIIDEFRLKFIRSSSLARCPLFRKILSDPDRIWITKSVVECLDNSSASVEECCWGKRT